MEICLILKMIIRGPAGEVYKKYVQKHVIMLHRKEKQAIMKRKGKEQVRGDGTYV